MNDTSLSSIARASNRSTIASLAAEALLARLVAASLPSPRGRARAARL